MKPCDGTPAEQFAQPYVEGGLAVKDADRFEEHYFECEVCFAYLETLQAVRAGLAKLPPASIPGPEPRRRAGWRTAVLAAGSAAALLMLGALLTLGIYLYPGVHRGVETAHVAQKAFPASPAAEPQAASEQQTATRELADLSLPPYQAAVLRGDSLDAAFQRGMKSYSAGDCMQALPQLSAVSPQSSDAPVAKFYAGVCRMHGGDLAAASAMLQQIAGAGDSPEQESAIYYLAQLALERGDAVTAHKELQRAIALNGDLERKARAEDARVVSLLSAAAGDVPGGSAMR